MKKKTKNINYIIFSLIFILIIFIIYNLFNKKIENFKIEDHKDIIIYTYGNEYKKFKTLAESCDKNNVNIYMHGIGDKWIDYSNKLKNFHKFLENIEDTKIVIFVDGFDIIIFDNPENMKNKFLEFNKTLVFSAETYCWPDSEVNKYYPEKTKNERFRYVNSGTYMGYAKDLKEMLNTFKEKNYNCDTYPDKVNDKCDDQRCLTYYYLNNIDKVALDHKQKIWCVCAGTNREDFDLDINTYNNLYNKITNEKSSILHTNGWNKWYKDLYID
jgi:hypothetical protein